MATLEELKEKVKADDALYAEYMKAAETTEGLEAFLAEQGCDASIEDAMAFAKSGTGELADDELDMVTGGCSCRKAPNVTHCEACGSDNVFCDQKKVGSVYDYYGFTCGDCGHVTWD